MDVIRQDVFSIDELALLESGLAAYLRLCRQFAGEDEQEGYDGAGAYWRAQVADVESLRERLARMVGRR